ncbi:MAG: hypothetical protein LBI03_06580 [Clostridiales bacterium]|nr:hypothetical protein [Clostridiales bacterium]
MQGESWDGHVPYEEMNIAVLSKTLKDAIDSFNQLVEFRDTKYCFNKTSLKDYLCVVCKNNDNRRKIVKKSGALSKTFVDTLRSGSSERFSFILDAIKDEPDLKGLCDKIEKMI